VLVGDQFRGEHAEPLLEQRPVGQPGQRIVTGPVAESFLGHDVAGHVGERGGQRTVGEPVDAHIDPRVGDLGEREAFGRERLAGVGDVEGHGAHEPTRGPVEQLVESGPVHLVVLQVEHAASGRVGRSEDGRVGVGQVGELEHDHTVGCVLDGLGEPCGLQEVALVAAQVDEQFVGSGAPHQQLSVGAVGGEHPDDGIGLGPVVGGQVVRVHQTTERAGQVERPVVPAQDRGHGGGDVLALDQHDARSIQQRAVLVARVLDRRLEESSAPLTEQGHGHGG
jgi:hypothetical protein